jgi:hypothetical protein
VKSWRAEVRRWLACLTAGAVQLGCATTWHERLAEDGFRIFYSDRNDLCALLYAAELTAAAGYGHFFATHGFGPSVSITYTPGPATTQIVDHGQLKTVACMPGLPSCGGSYSSSETPSGYEIHLLPQAPDPEETWSILRQRGLRATDLFVYEASVVRSSFRAAPEIDCDFELPLAPGAVPPEPTPSASDAPVSEAPVSGTPPPAPARRAVLSVHAAEVEPDIAADLEDRLAEELVRAGFGGDFDDPRGALRIDVEVQGYDPGSQLLRLTVGLGAGRGSLRYRARYSGPDGRLLEELAAEERFTGMEPSYGLKYGPTTGMRGAERVRRVLIQEAARRIVESCPSP